MYVFLVYSLQFKAGLRLTLGYNLTRCFGLGLHFG